MRAEEVNTELQARASRVVDYVKGRDAMRHGNQYHQWRMIEHMEKDCKRLRKELELVGIDVELLDV